MRLTRVVGSSCSAVALLLGVAVSGAQAATISFSDSIPITSTDWIGSVSLAKFNPALGALTSVDLSLTGTIDSSISVENTSTRARTIGVTLTDDLALTGPSAGTSLTVTSNITTSDALAGFDGTADFAGPDSAEHPGLTNTVSNSVTTSTPSDLTLFTGLGPIVMPVAATGGSLVTAASNVRTDLENAAGVTAEVTYAYTPRVAEPGVLFLLGAGLLGVAALGFGRSRGQETGL